MNISSFSNFLIGCVMLTLILGLVQSTVAQEIDADITIDRSQVSGTSLNFLDDLSSELESYISEYQWTSTNFRDYERINMQMQITLLSVDNDYNVEAQAFIRSSRPIYHSTRQTAVFLFSDDNWVFNYTPNRSLIHDELQFDELTSFIDFYVYIVLGFDFDSFAQLGGSSYFRDAQDIVSLAQTTSADGWSRGNNRRNRAQLTSDLLSNSFEPYRQAIYQYHRHGLDLFLRNPEEARQQVLQALEKIQQSQRNTSSNMLFDIFFNAKYRELVSIFEDAEPQVRLEAFNLLSEIDQSHLSTYRDLE